MIVIYGEVAIFVCDFNLNRQTLALKQACLNVAQAIFKKNTLFLASSAFLFFLKVAFYTFIITRIAYLLKKSLKQYRLLF